MAGEPHSFQHTEGRSGDQTENSCCASNIVGPTVEAEVTTPTPTERAQLWVTYDGCGVCRRNYPRAVNVVHDAADMLANDRQADH
jgi:hypothetical protein